MRSLAVKYLTISHLWIWTVAKVSADQAAIGMLQRVIVVHYHEIGLKGHNRASFEKRLAFNLEKLLYEFPIVTIHRLSGRIIIFLKEGTSESIARSCCDLASRIPGVAKASSGFKCARDMSVIEETSLIALREAGDFQTFKVDSRRAHTDFEPGSMEINRIVGAALCDAFPDKKVRMKSPDATVWIEVVQNAAYVYCYTAKGVGGLPVGCSGKMLALLSSGIDSPVAIWRMARRGATVNAIHFSGAPETSSTSEYLVEDIKGVLKKFGCIKDVYVVEFGEYQRKIALDCPPALRIVLYRRLMLKVAEALAERINAGALVTGESLGQVASQTLNNIRATDEAVSMPILRPLIGMDKIDIIDDAKELGTFDISTQDAPDCCTLFMPRNPETQAKLHDVLEAESAFPEDEWIAEILDAIRTI